MKHSLNPYLAPILAALEQFLTCHEICNEHQIIKHLQNKHIPPFDQLSLAQPKELFSAHFLCMHALYHLKNQYKHQQSFKLIIQSVHIERIKLSDPPTANKLLQTSLEKTDPLESYYLNASHYFETQEHEINDMLKAFWLRYIAQDARTEALEVLALPENADSNMIKASYRRLAQLHHPDKGGCAKLFNKIRQAKAVLDKCKD